jgi:hypothetical protein
MIMLIGIVEKNAIMQIDFALDAQRRGMSAEEADLSGVPRPLSADHDDDDGRPCSAPSHRDRLRRGREARQPLGLVVVGGLFFSQLVTLYLTPVVFIYMARLQEWLERRSQPAGQPTLA